MRFQSDIFDYLIFGDEDPRRLACIMLDCMIKVHGDVGVKSGTQLDRFYENFFS